MVCLVACNQCEHIPGGVVRSFAEFMFEALSSKNEMLMKYGEQCVPSLSCVYYAVVILSICCEFSSLA